MSQQKIQTEFLLHANFFRNRSFELAFRLQIRRLFMSEGNHLSIQRCNVTRDHFQSFQTARFWSHFESVLAKIESSKSQILEWNGCVVLHATWSTTRHMTWHLHCWDCIFLGSRSSWDFSEMLVIMASISLSECLSEGSKFNLQ